MEINQEARISPRASREDILLIPWIRDNSHCVFGEEIEWEKSVELHSMRHEKIQPDFIGKDSQGHLVIVEVKFKFEFQDDKNHLRRDIEDKSIGQILQYACAYRRRFPGRNTPRLFIVSIDFSPDVEDVCKFLRSKGINIRHLSLEKLL